MVAIFTAGEKQSLRTQNVSWLFDFHKVDLVKINNCVKVNNVHLINLYNDHKNVGIRELKCTKENRPGPLLDKEGK